ncbi:hypothetical protein [Actinosynnema sp. NPDC020468]|uniref:hypothetical protein n=1 Tax=Actinosynnema sp. NPDC020468 TaxID=3154488 RepID=UPI0033C4B093
MSRPTRIASVLVAGASAMIAFAGFAGAATATEAPPAAPSVAVVDCTTTAVDLIDATRSLSQAIATDNNVLALAKLNSVKALFSALSGGCIKSENLGCTAIASAAQSHLKAAVTYASNPGQAFTEVQAFGGEISNLSLIGCLKA